MWIIAAWAALAVLFAPKASRVQQVLAVRGGAVERSESARASQLLREEFPNPIADYVAIVVHGPVRYTNPRFVTVIDSISAALTRQSYISQVVSARTIGESTFVHSPNADRIASRNAGLKLAALVGAKKTRMGLS